MAPGLHLLARKPTDSVTLGFLPAAARLGLEVTVITDAPDDHRRAYEGLPHAPAEVLGCEVRDFRALVSLISRRRRPHAIFSNSDHLQAETALAAAYFGLSGKDWRGALRAKNKALMRARLADLRLDELTVAELSEEDDPDALAVRPLPYPLVLKPRDGVASEDVVLVRDAAELVGRARQIRARRGGALLAEAYLPGELRTLETLSDGRTRWVLGSFHTTLSALPYFIEERLEWAPDLPYGVVEAVLDQLDALGVDFGACHTEFVLSGGRPRLIEVNDRLIGDHDDLLLADLLGLPLFERVLRVHLGEPLAGETPRALGRGMADNVVAGTAGTLVEAPGALDLEWGEAHLAYRPLRSIGDAITITHTNRDYLGILRVTGPDAGTVRAAAADFRSRNRWRIIS